ncbi:hypothetical protein Tco_0398182 [Tanacetum coccineum]
MDACLDKLSVDFDEELTAIAGHRWVIRHDMYLAVMKYAESLEIRYAFADVMSTRLSKDLKDLKYPLVDQLERLKDALMDIIIASVILIYPEVCDPENPCAFKEEMLLEDAIAENISQAKKKKKCRVVCCTHRIGSAHHARSNGIPVSVPTIAPQGAGYFIGGCRHTDLGR